MGWEQNWVLGLVWHWMPEAVVEMLGDVCT